MKKFLSLSFKFVVITCALLGILVVGLGSKEAFMGGGSVFMFFTVQSNILISLVDIALIIIMYCKKTPNRFMHVLKYVSTVAISLTGIVFCFALAPTMGKFAWNFPNILLHVVVPAFAIFDFFFRAEEYKTRKFDSVFALIPPLAYVIFASVGYVLNWEFMPGTNYPYFFLNWGSEAGAFGFSSNLPFIGCAYWIIILGAAIYGIASLYLYFVKVCKKNKK